MPTPSRLRRIALLALTCALVVAAPAAAKSKTYWYVSLGDSLARGVQADATTGASVITDRGYADLLYRSMKADIPGLRLKKLGCPGESTASMVKGGVCKNRSKPQLAQAVEFLRKHRSRLALVTLDIGANDVQGCVAGTTVDFACITSGTGAVAGWSPLIAKRLRRAAGKKAVIAGMTYYNPFLAASLTGVAGQTLAAMSTPLAEGVNETLTSAFTGQKFVMADVAAAFESTNENLVAVPGLGQLPTNVARICGLTWMCTKRDIHPNDTGYELIADTFAKATGAVR